MHRPLCTRFNVENAGDFSVGGARLCFRIPENPLLPASGGCREGKSAPAGRRFWNERSTDEKEKTYDKGYEWDEEKTRPSGTGQDAEADQGSDSEVLPRQLRGSQVQGREVRPESGGLYQGAALAATVTARHTPEENALLRSLAGMANNLNQLTKLSHQAGFYRTRLLIDGLLGKLKRIMDDYRPKGG